MTNQVTVRVPINHQVGRVGQVTMILWTALKSVPAGREVENIGLNVFDDPAAATTTWEVSLYLKEQG